MENMHDYSGYVTMAYLLAGLAIAGLMLFIVAQYLSIKSKIKNEKSA